MSVKNGNKRFQIYMVVGYALQYKKMGIGEQRVSQRAFPKPADRILEGSQGRQRVESNGKGLCCIAIILMYT
jgi:hypothetical protein